MSFILHLKAQKEKEFFNHDWFVQSISVETLPPIISNNMTGNFIHLNQNLCIQFILLLKSKDQIMIYDN